MIQRAVATPSRLESTTPPATYQHGLRLSRGRRRPPRPFRLAPAQKTLPPATILAKEKQVGEVGLPFLGRPGEFHRTAAEKGGHRPEDGHLRGQHRPYYPGGHRQFHDGPLILFNAELRLLRGLP